MVTLTHRGYVKRQPLRVFRAQKRGGVGLKGARPTAGGEAPSGTREEDYAAHLLTTHTHASMLFFTQSGRVFQLRVHEVPERERQAKGVPVNNLIDIGGNERITSVFVRPETETEAHYMLMVTKNGYIKKTALREYANVRRNGLIAINLQEGDELDWVTPTTGEDQVIIATALGKAIRFSYETTPQKDSFLGGPGSAAPPQRAEAALRAALRPGHKTSFNNLVGAREQRRRHPQGDGPRWEAVRDACGWRPGGRGPDHQHQRHGAADPRRRDLTDRPADPGGDRDACCAG